jgi:hypothetical protein
MTTESALEFGIEIGHIPNCRRSFVRVGNGLSTNSTFFCELPVRLSRPFWENHNRPLPTLSAVGRASSWPSLECPEFCDAVKKAEAQRLLLRLERIEAGEQGWQGIAWALERIYPARFARPEVLNQIAVVQRKAPAERVIVLPGEEFDALIDRPGYRLRDNEDLERQEGNLLYVIVRQRSHLLLGE